MKMCTRSCSRRAFLIGTAQLCTLAVVGCAAPTLVLDDVRNHRVHVALERLSKDKVNVVYLPAIQASAAIRYDDETKDEASRWSTILMVCTHRGCGVNVDQKGFQCPCHGSRFSLNGDVQRGPAKESLAHLPCRVSQQELMIFLPT